MKNFLLILFLIACGGVFGQSELNNYKYIIVPKKFDGFKKENQYKTSTLLKFLLVKKGYNAIYDDALPTELNSNRCLALSLDLNDNSSMFATKAAIVLKDCNSKEIFVTLQGTSRRKDYEGSYNEALTKAFASFDDLEYSYMPKETKEETKEETVTVSYRNDVKNVKVDTDKESKNKKDDRLIEQVATAEEQVYDSKEPVASDIKLNDTVKEQMPNTAAAKANVLYAQEIPNGYQLVDSTPKITMRVYKSSLPDYYLATAGDKHGMVYKKQGKWYFEYYSDGRLQIEEMQIKF